MLGAHANGVNTKPAVTVSAVCGFRFGLPPVTWLKVLAVAIFPYCACVTPLLAQAPRDAVGVLPAQGSVARTCDRLWLRNNSWPFGARTALLTVPRARIRSTGAHSKPKL